MYLKNIELENNGPIDYINLTLHEGHENPKPIIIVGENGSGKSILLSHIVNCMIAAKQEIFEDVEVERGKVYKYRSPLYVKSGSYYSFSQVNFSASVSVTEWQLLQSRSDFEQNLAYTPARQSWPQIPENEASHFSSNFANYRNDVEKMVKQQCNLYFPVNRFEDPGWLNVGNLTSRAKYTDIKRISGYSNRNIICTSPLRENRDWLLDVLFDRQMYELQMPTLMLPASENQPPQMLRIFGGYRGQSNAIYEAILRLLKVVLREEGNIRFGIGNRKQRQISIIKDEAAWIPNLFQLSTGEVQLLNLFLSILRDFDLSDASFNELADVKGIVVIDEIDAHLHSGHQIDVLPELIASFPGVQFIVTTHSPLFLMGMERALGENGFKIIDMPKGNQIVSSDFSEFVSAHDEFKRTERYREQIGEELIRLSKPIVFVEGDYDVRYLNRAAHFLGKEDVLARVEVRDGDGFGNLDKIWKSYNNHISTVLPGKVILMYDCDISKQNADNSKIFRRVMPTIQENPVKIGIENLFPPATIEKLEAANPRFIDVRPQTLSRIRGEEVVQSAVTSVNKDEKRNVCDWLCLNGQQEDFANFQVIFRIIEEIAAA